MPPRFWKTELEKYMIKKNKIYKGAYSLSSMVIF